MSDSQLNVPVSDLRSILLSWLQDHVDEEGNKWLAEKSDKMLGDIEDWEFFSSFSAVPRYTGKEKLSLTEEQLRKAEEIRHGWEPAHWQVDQLGRTLFLLSITDGGKDSFLQRLEKTFVSSDMGEAVALYQALPVLPYPGELAERGAEGIRSNITSVFNAVALHNPYPADYFDEGAWNQLVLKALFVQSPLYKITGIDRRKNEELAEMLVDYAHERWAAGRTVSPELWRPVGPFATGNILDDLERVLENDDPLQQQAAVLALSASSASDAKALVEQHQDILDTINKKNITWDDIGARADDYRD